MKLIKIAAAALITLSSFAAQAGLMYIDGGANLPVPTNNYFKNVLNPQTYNIGGNLKANQTESLFLSFEFLGKEAGWTNTFTSEGNTITTSGGSFSYSKAYTLGELIQFTFKTGGAVVPNTVANGNNNDGEELVSFAIALDTEFNGVMYDAILFFDDTGGYKDDDNHDDLVIGIKASVPESSTFVLMLMGLAGLFAARRLKA
jgi:hypothetical protein